MEEADPNNSVTGTIPASRSRAGTGTRSKPADCLGLGEDHRYSTEDAQRLNWEYDQIKAPPGAGEGSYTRHLSRVKDKANFKHKQG